MVDQANALGAMPIGAPQVEQPTTETPQPQSAGAHDFAKVAGELHSAASARFDKVLEVGGQLTAMREQLDRLVNLGDQIEMTAVVEAAGDLTAKGIDPKMLATLLAQAPQGGETLAGWIKQLDDKIKGDEQQFAQLATEARHELGVSALHALTAEHLGTQREKSPYGDLERNAVLSQEADPEYLAAQRAVGQQGIRDWKR